MQRRILWCTNADMFIFLQDGSVMTTASLIGLPMRPAGSTHRNIEQLINATTEINFSVLKEVTLPKARNRVAGLQVPRFTAPP